MRNLIAVGGLVAGFTMMVISAFQYDWNVGIFFSGYAFWRIGQALLHEEDL